MTSRDRVPWLSEPSYNMVKDLSFRKVIRTINLLKVYNIADFEPSTIPCFDEHDLRAIHREMRTLELIPSFSSSACSTMSWLELKCHVLVWFHIRSPNASKYSNHTDIVRQRNAVSVALTELIQNGQVAADPMFDYHTYGIAHPSKPSNNVTNGANSNQHQHSSSTSTASAHTENEKSLDKDPNMVAYCRLPYLRRYRAQCSSSYELVRIINTTPFRYTLTQPDDGKHVYRANMINIEKMNLASDEVVFARIFALPTNCISEYETVMKNAKVLDQTLLRTDFKYHMFSSNINDPVHPEILHGLSVTPRLERLMKYGSLIRRDADFFVFVNDRAVECDKTNQSKVKALQSNRHKKFLPHLIDPIDITEQISAGPKSTGSTQKNEINFEIACRIAGNKDIPLKDTTDWSGFVILELCRKRTDDDIIALVVSRPKLDLLPASLQILQDGKSKDLTKAETVQRDANNGSLMYVRCVVCSSPKVQRCSACKSEWYCSRDHQILHWRYHKMVCPVWKAHGRPSVQLDAELANQQALSLDDHPSKKRKTNDDTSINDNSTVGVATTEPQVMNDDDDDDELIVEDEDLKVALTCPVSLNRMKYPVRGINCSHLQCYNLQEFIEISESSLVYCCLYCNKHVPFEEIAMSEQLKIAVDTFPESHSHVMSSKTGPYYEVPSLDFVNHSGTGNGSNGTHSSDKSSHTSVCLSDGDSLQSQIKPEPPLVAPQQPTPPTVIEEVIDLCDD